MTAEDLVRWDAELRFLADGLGCLFKRPEPRVTFTLMVRAMLADTAKKNSWGLAEYAGSATSQAFEHLLNGAKWSADELRNQIRGYVLAGLADPGGALILDDTQAIKKGDKSVGVRRAIRRGQGYSLHVIALPETHQALLTAAAALATDSASSADRKAYRIYADRLNAFALVSQTR